jgi:dTDP-4-amino-4,6-dideoxygalactose transaminase
LKIPFSPPYIDQDIVDAVVNTLKSGWITSGPAVKELELLTQDLFQVEKAVAVNSWTSGAMLTLKWLGIGPGDEVIIPAYTYAATALAVMHRGAKPIMVDVKADFTIDETQIEKFINSRTKAIIAVDLAGWPCSYEQIKKLICCDQIKKQFNSTNDIQGRFGRIALISDAAHSIGSIYQGKPAAMASDITIFSFHAVKNITTAEGGMICLSLPVSFSNAEIYQWMKLNTLNGQTKDAYSKTQGNDWKYDIVSDGLKINLPDVLASIGVAQLKKYHSYLLPERRRVFNHYARFFSDKPWASVAHLDSSEKKSSYHVFALKISGIRQSQRDWILNRLYEEGISANVHFVPLPLLTLFRNLDYDISEFPMSFKNYSEEISLPIYPQLSDEQCSYIEKRLESIFYESGHHSFF